MSLLKFVLFIWQVYTFSSAAGGHLLHSGTSLFWEVIGFVYNHYHLKLKYKRWVKNSFLNIFLCVSAREMSAEQQEIESGTVVHWERPSKESDDTRYSSQKHFSHQERIRDGVLHLDKCWICWHHSSHPLCTQYIHYICTPGWVRASKCLVKNHRKLYKGGQIASGFTLCTRLDGRGCFMLLSLSRSAVTPCRQCRALWLSLLPTAPVPGPQPSPWCLPALQGPQPVSPHTPCQAGGSKPGAQPLFSRGWYLQVLLWQEVWLPAGASSQHCPNTAPVDAGEPRGWSLEEILLVGIQLGKIWLKKCRFERAVACKGTPVWNCNRQNKAFLSTKWVLQTEWCNTGENTPLQNTNIVKEYTNENTMLFHNGILGGFSEMAKCHLCRR